MKRSLGLGLLLALALSFGAPPAFANGRFPTAQQVVLGPGARSDVIALRTTFGLLVSRDGGRTFYWFCEDLLFYDFIPGGNLDPSIEINANGEIVVGFEVGAHALTDGCDSPNLGSVSGREITDLTSTPDGNLLYATESTTGMRAYVLRADASLTFQRMGAGLERLLFVTLEVAPSQTDRIYASGYDTTASQTPRLVRSDDGGATLRGLSPDQSLGDRAFVSGIDPTNADVVYVRALDLFATRLLRSADGGTHFDLVARIPDPMLGFAVSDDGATVWYGSAEDGLHRSTDRGLHFTQVSTIPVNGLRYHGGALWVVTDWTSQPFALGRSMDGGEHFEGVLRFEDVIGPPVCATPSAGTTICAERWAGFRPSIEPPRRSDGGTRTDALASTDAAAPVSDRPAPVDAGASPMDAGASPLDAGVVRAPVVSDCGCHVGATPSANAPWALALVAVALRRRRRVSIATELQ